MYKRVLCLQMVCALCTTMSITPARADQLAGTQAIESATMAGFCNDAAVTNEATSQTLETLVHAAATQNIENTEAANVLGKVAHSEEEILRDDLYALTTKKYNKRAVKKEDIILSFEQELREYKKKKSMLRSKKGGYWRTAWLTYAVPLASLYIAHGHENAFLALVRESLDDEEVCVVFLLHLATYIDSNLFKKRVHAGYETVKKELEEKIKKDNPSPAALAHYQELNVKIIIAQLFSANKCIVRNDVSYYKKNEHSAPEPVRFYKEHEDDNDYITNVDEMDSIFEDVIIYEDEDDDFNKKQEIWEEYAHIANYLKGYNVGDLQEADFLFFAKAAYYYYQSVDYEIVSGLVDYYNETKQQEKLEEVLQVALRAPQMRKTAKANYECFFNAFLAQVMHCKGAFDESKKYITRSWEALDVKFRNEFSKALTRYSDARTRHDVTGVDSARKKVLESMYHCPVGNGYPEKYKAQFLTVFFSDRAELYYAIAKEKGFAVSTGAEKSIQLDATVKDAIEKLHEAKYVCEVYEKRFPEKRNKKSDVHEWLMSVYYEIAMQLSGDNQQEMLAHVIQVYEETIEYGFAPSNKAHLNVAYAYVAIGKEASARTLIDEQLLFAVDQEVEGTADKKAHIARMYYELAHAGRKFSHLASSNMTTWCLLRARDLYKEIGDHYGECKALISLAHTAAQQGNVHEAFAYVNDAETVYEKENRNDMFEHGISHEAYTFLKMYVAMHNGGLTDNSEDIDAFFTSEFECHPLDIYMQYAINNDKMRELVLLLTKKYIHSLGNVETIDEKGQEKATYLIQFLEHINTVYVRTIMDEHAWDAYIAPLQALRTEKSSYGNDVIERVETVWRDSFARNTALKEKIQSIEKDVQKRADKINALKDQVSALEVLYDITCDQSQNDLYPHNVYEVKYRLLGAYYHTLHVGISMYTDVRQREICTRYIELLHDMELHPLYDPQRLITLKYIDEFGNPPKMIQDTMHLKEGALERVKDSPTKRITRKIHVHDRKNELKDAQKMAKSYEEKKAVLKEYTDMINTLIRQEDILASEEFDELLDEAYDVIDCVSDDVSYNPEDSTLKKQMFFINNALYGQERLRGRITIELNDKIRIFNTNQKKEDAANIVGWALVKVMHELYPKLVLNEEDLRLILYYGRHVFDRIEDENWGVFEKAINDVCKGVTLHPAQISYALKVSPDSLMKLINTYATIRRKAYASVAWIKNSRNILFSANNEYKVMHDMLRAQLAYIALKKHNDVVLAKACITEMRDDVLLRDIQSRISALEQALDTHARTEVLRAA